MQTIAPGTITVNTLALTIEARLVMEGDMLMVNRHHGDLSPTDHTVDHFLVGEAHFAPGDMVCIHAADGDDTIAFGRNDKVTVVRTVVAHDLPTD